MPITFLNLAMLAGLAAVLVPPIIHLLNRKRYDVVRWGAMRFLDVTERTRRRVFLEELLLMIIRMGLIAVMVLALAAPLDANRWFDFLADRGRRDVVLVVDGSYSMGYRGDGETAHDAAKAWATSLLDDLGPDDAVAVVHARQRPTLLVEPTRDFDQVRTVIQSLPAPRGGCDGPAAVGAAIRTLAKSTAARREVIVLTDGQRHGWTDDTAALGWEQSAGESPPRVWLVNLDPRRPADPPNRSVVPIRASRAVSSAGQEITFRTAVERHGAGDLPAGRLRLLVDGKPAGDLSPPSVVGEKGQTPFSVRHRFSAGSHLVSIQAEPDALPGDDRQDFALEVLPQLPVLLVDGDPNVAATRRGSDFLRDALAPARDSHPAVLARVVSVADLDTAVLARDLAGPGTAPRVIVLCNVGRISAPQQATIAAFVEKGGGLLVAHGDRWAADDSPPAKWLPAKTTGPAGDLNNPAKAVQPLPATFFHPALELFREPQPGGLGDARFSRYWKLTVPAGSSAVVIGRLTGDDPFVVEKPFGTGRVLQTCVPLDNTWRTNLVELPAFAPLAHEFVYYLAGARSTALNLTPGQPLRYRLANGMPVAGWVLQPPVGPERPVDVRENQIVVEDTQEPGVYTLKHSASGAVRYYVVQSDPGESNLSPWTDADRERVKRALPAAEFNDDRSAIVAGITRAPQPAELWWVFMLGVIALLSAEVSMTRRRALAAGLS
jgi:hypothetical protein